MHLYMVVHLVGPPLMHTSVFITIYVGILQDSAVCTSNSEIKSRAVVKYSAAPPPTSYALLQEKTDLKLPPANWLRENPQLGSAGTTILGSSSKSKPFSRYNTIIMTVKVTLVVYEKVEKVTQGFRYMLCFNLLPYKVSWILVTPFWN